MSIYIIILISCSQSLSLIAGMTSPLPIVPVTGVTLKIAFDASNSIPTEYGGVADATVLIKSNTKSNPNTNITTNIAANARFTSSASLDMVHRLRRVSDGVLVGKGTVAVDDCTLTVRRVPMIPEDAPQPTRVVIDPSLSLFHNNKDKDSEYEYEYEMFQDGHPVIVYHTCSSCPSSQNKNIHFVCANTNVEVESSSDSCVTNNTNNGINSIISPTFIVQNLAQQFNIHHIMVEGGPSTALTFLKQGVVDRAIIVKAPIRFEDPIPSRMNQQHMMDAGLMLLGQFTNDGGDDVECWVKNGAVWPGGENLDSWP